MAHFVKIGSHMSLFLLSALYKSTEVEVNLRLYRHAENEIRLLTEDKLAGYFL